MIYNYNSQHRTTIIACIISMAIFAASSCNPTENKINHPISEAEKNIAKDLIQGAFDDLWGGVDSTKILNYHTPDFYILEQGEVWDNTRIIQYMRGQLARLDRPRRVNKMDYLYIDKYGESISIAYNNYAEFYQADSLVGSAQWLESAIAIHTENGWRLRSMHSTRVSNNR